MFSRKRNGRYRSRKQRKLWPTNLPTAFWTKNTDVFSHLGWGGLWKDMLLQYYHIQSHIDMKFINFYLSSASILLSCMNFLPELLKWTLYFACSHKLLAVFWDKVSLYSPVWLWTGDPPVSAFKYSYYKHEPPYPANKLCVYMHKCSACADMHACICTCMEARSQSWVVFLGSNQSCFFQTGSLSGSCLKFF